MRHCGKEGEFTGAWWWQPALLVVHQTRTIVQSHMHQFCCRLEHAEALVLPPSLDTTTDIVHWALPVSSHSYIRLGRPCANKHGPVRAMCMALPDAKHAAFKAKKLWRQQRVWLDGNMTKAPRRGLCVMKVLALE